jgi:hypothetical protein
MQLQSDAAGRAAAAAPGGERTMSELLELGETTAAALFASATSRGRVYMTGDLRALTGLSRTHMDFYLREGIVQPTARTGSGYLLFDDAELETLRAVLRWREEGIGIREIRDRLGRPAAH